MLSGVMEHFGFGKSLHPVVYYDSAYHPTLTPADTFQPMTREVPS